MIIPLLLGAYSTPSILLASNCVPASLRLPLANLHTYILLHPITRVFSRHVLHVYPSYFTAEFRSCVVLMKNCII